MGDGASPNQPYFYTEVTVLPMFAKAQQDEGGPEGPPSHTRF